MLPPDKNHSSAKILIQGKGDFAILPLVSRGLFAEWEIGWRVKLKGGKTTQQLFSSSQYGEVMLRRRTS